MISAYFASKTQPAAEGFSKKTHFCTERRIHKERPGDEPVSVSALKAAETNSALHLISVAAC